MVGTRTQWYRSLAVIWAWEEAAWQDDKEFTVEDIDETLYAVAALGFIWKGNIILAAVPGLAIAEGIVIVGGVASFAIGGVEGVENYIDFITTPSKYKERTKESLQIIYEQKIEDPLVAAAEWYVDKVDRGIDWAEKKVDQGLELLSYGRWANPTPGFGIF
jgi:hypothetical protein